MKSFSFFSFMLLLVFHASAQTNLEYAETINLEIEGTTSNNYSIVLYNFTVPEGQTWKIESALVTRKFVNGLSRDYATTGDLKLLLDDNLFLINSSSYNFHFPYWLSSGDHTFELMYTNTWNTNYTGRANMSILKFNIVE